MTERLTNNPEHQKKSFDEQFENLISVDTAGGKADVVDITPAHAKDASPVLFAPAWACTLPIYKPALKTLSEQGRRVISLNHPRLGGKIELTAEEKELVKDYPEVEVRKALTLLDVLSHEGVEKDAAIIGHSEGSMNGAIATLIELHRAEKEKRVRRIENLNFFAPPGLTGEDSPKRLWEGFTSQGNPKPSLNEIPVSEEEKQQTLAEGRVAIEYPAIGENPEAHAAIVGSGKIPIVGKELGKYVMKNPVRALQEGLGMAKTQMDDLIQKLHERGIGIVIMSGVDDPVFDTKTMAERMKKGTVDGFLAVRGGHGQIGDNPERYMVAAEQMLTALEEKKRKAAEIANH